MISVAGELVNIQLEQNEGTAFAEQIQNQKAKQQELMQALKAQLDAPVYSDNLKRALEEADGKE